MRNLKRATSFILALLLVLSLFSIPGISLEGKALEAGLLHQHNFLCYESSEVTCGMEHEHLLSCYAGTGNLVCGLEEGIYYNEGDFTSEYAGALLHCIVEEHTHDGSCQVETVFGEDVFTANVDVFGNDFESTEYICGKEEHLHSDECYTPLYVERAVGSAGDVTDIPNDDTITDVNPDHNNSVLSPDDDTIFGSTNPFGSTSFADTGLRISLGWPQGSTMEGTTHVNTVDSERYVMFGPTLGINKSGAIAVNEVTVRVPRYVESGRVGRGNVRGEFKTDMLPFGWSYTLNGDSYILTNTTRFASGNNISFSLYYYFDAKQTQSDKQWAIKAELLDTANNVIDTQTVTGKIRTSVGLTVSENSGSVGAFLGIDTSTSRITQYQDWLYTYFGLTKAQYESDSANYVYDILSKTVTPTGMQDYTATFYITPGRYPSLTYRDLSNGSYYCLYGGGATVVGAMVAPHISTAGSYGFDTSAIQKFSNFSSSALSNAISADYDSSIANSSNFGCMRYHNKSTSGWRTYSFTMNTSPELNGTGKYVVAVLCRFPKSTVVAKHGGWVSGASIYLDAGIRVVHNGVDNGSAFADGRGTLYNGICDNVDYSGNIYAADYSDASAMLNKDSLLRGNSVTLNTTSNFWAANTNRANYSRNDAAPYELDCMLDKIILRAGDQSYMLNDDDYTFTGVVISVLDTYGYTSIDSEGNMNMFFEDTALIPGAKRNETLELYYGTSHNDTSDWVKYTGKELTVGDCWGNTATDGMYIPLSGLTGKNITHLKVVYPTSQHNTKVIMAATIKLLPTAHIRGILNTNSRIWVANWLAYHAYSRNGALDLAVERERVDTSAATGNTGAAVRTWDDTHKYRGVANSQYPYRNFVHTELVESADFAGMSVLQLLVDGSGSPVGGAINSYQINDTPARKRSVIEVSKVVVGFTGGLYNGNSLKGLYDHSFLKDAFTSAVNDIRKSAAGSPYGFHTQRYYVLLPAGFTITKNYNRPLVQNGLGDQFSTPYGMSYYWRTLPWSVHNLSAVLDKVGDYNSQKYVGFMSSVYDATQTSIHTVKTEVVDGRELVVIDVPVGSPSVANLYLGVTLNYTRIKDYAISPIGLGCGLTLAMVPKNGKTVPSGTYEIQYATEFLDEEGNAYDLSQFTGEVYDNLKDAFPTSPLGDYLGISKNGKTYLAISSTFQNISGNGNSYAQVLVNDSFSAELPERGDSYTYTLNYGITSGTSTNVILFDALETDTSTGLVPEWQGKINYVDMNGTGATLWVNTNAVDLQEYQDKNINASGLSNRGWVKVSNPTTYTGYDKVKAIAIDFGSKTFDSSASDTSMASVYVHMTSPQDVANAHGADLLTTYNEIAFYDKHSTGAVGTNICNVVEVTIPVEQEAAYTQLFPETGGTGTQAYVLVGGMLVLAGIYFLCKRKKLA